jgi:hypothetical protein
MRSSSTARGIEAQYRATIKKLQGKIGELGRILVLEPAFEAHAVCLDRTMRHALTKHFDLLRHWLGGRYLRLSFVVGRKMAFLDGSP